MKINRKKMATDRIEILMKKAEEIYSKDRTLADRYATMAKKLSMRHNARFPHKWKRRICKKCGRFLIVGNNCRVRTYKSRVIITCLECDNVARIPYK